MLSENTRERLRDLLEAAGKDASAKPGTNERKIGDLYAGCADTAAVDALGAKPLETHLKRVAAVRSVKDLTAAIVAAQDVTNVGPVDLTSLGDLKDANDVILYIDVGGLSLPEKDYYFKDDARSKEIRDEFVKHAARMLELLGDKPEAATASAKALLAFETKLADAAKNAVERRDIPGLYHKMDFAGVKELAPAFDWKGLFASFRIAESAPINVTEPEFLKRVNQQLTAAPLEDWKTWLRWRLVDGVAPILSKPFVDESFHFRSTVLRGVKEQQPRWRTCANITDGAMGEALGRLYVEKYFPPDAKQRAKELVDNLKAALGEQIQGADWLAAETRKNALAKLNAFVAKLGYPDKWRDYSALRIDRKSFFDNVSAAAKFEREFQLAKIGKPVDRDEWGMSPPTLNAYYNPQFNEIVFPAGILQKPFFDPQGDDAMNYGAIGAVIGHEMGHGFDDQGSQFDAQGNMKNWWTEADKKSFDQRAACLIEQFDNLDIGDGLRHKGQLVVGEAMGDLNGLKLAYAAYKRSLRGKPEPPVIDGFTADQRFFLSFARAWGTQVRLQQVQLMVNTDPHPVPKYRANATLQNMPEFQKAFQCKAGDPMVRPPEKQCKLW